MLFYSGVVGHCAVKCRALTLFLFVVYTLHVLEFSECNFISMFLFCPGSILCVQVLVLLRFQVACPIKFCTCALMKGCTMCIWQHKVNEAVQAEVTQLLRFQEELLQENDAFFKGSFGRL